MRILGPLILALIPIRIYEYLKALNPVSLFIDSVFIAVIVVDLLIMWRRIVKAKRRLKDWVSIAKEVGLIDMD